jgi:hypothetical protein
MIKTAILAIVLTILVVAAQKNPGVIPEAARDAGSAIADHATKVLKESGGDLSKVVTGALAPKAPEAAPQAAPVAATSPAPMPDAPAFAPRPAEASGAAPLPVRDVAVPSVNAPPQNSGASGEATIQAYLREAARLLGETTELSR